MLKVEQMTPEQKLGRVMCARRFGNAEDIEFTLELIKKGACGALQIKSTVHSDELIKKFRDAADYPVLVVIDMEQGFPPSKLPKIPMETLAACNNPEYTRAFAAALAKEAKEHGYSGCWGPIVDVLLVNGPCSVHRKAGDTPEAVMSVAREIFKVFYGYNFQGTAKHYPGGQDSPLDTHMAEGTSSLTEEELLSCDLVPYLELMKEGVLPAIMSGHQVCPKIDDLPASMSKKVIDIIRSRGFDGVMYTDSFAMMGILQKYGEARAMSMAIMAGNDIVLPNYRTPTREAYNMLVESYYNGEISDERLDEAVRRVMKLEEFCAKAPENPTPVPENIVEILKNIAKDAITAELRGGVSASVNKNEKRLFVVVTPQTFDASDIGAEISDGKWYQPGRVAEAIGESFGSSDIIFIPEFPTAQDNDNVLNTATGYDRVVFVTFCETGAYVGTDCLTRRMEALIEAVDISGKLEALVHFGNPLALNTVRKPDRVILGYNAPDSQKYAIMALAGEIEAKGKNPYARLYEK